jgi:dipeptidyl aminopeptidase/acylaminoacyl peptidase
MRTAFIVALTFSLLCSDSTSCQTPDPADSAPKGQSPRPRATLKGHTHYLHAAAFSPNGKTLATASSDRTVKLWDVATGKEAGGHTEHTAVVTSVAFSPDGRTLASGAWDLSVKLWDVASGKVRAELRGHADGINAIAFSPDGKLLASASADSTVKLWDVSSGKERASLRAAGDRTVAFSPDGKLLASAGWEKTIKLWDVATAANVSTLTGHTGGINTVAFGPDSTLLASGSDDHTVKLWDAGGGRERATLQKHGTWVLSVAFSPDGRTLASASYDKTITLWEVATRNERRTLAGHGHAVRAAVFSPDGKTLASASMDESVNLWDVFTVKTEPIASAVLPSIELEELWRKLADDNSASAYIAMQTLAGTPVQAALILTERLRPVAGPTDKQITAWIADLDSDRFVVRQRATDELAKLGRSIELALRSKLAEKPPLEVVQRLEQLLLKIEHQQLSPDSIRVLRAIEVLEHIGSTDAKQLLQKLVTGGHGALATHEAKASLTRLNKRS